MTTSAPLSTEPANAYPGRWKAMAVVALAVSIIIMDGTVVNVVMPVLIRDLGLTAADAEWVNSVYSLVFAALLITAGRLGDSFGRKRFLLVGAAIFGIASLLAAISGTGAALIAARTLQGVGGAMILPATLSTVNAMFSGRERAIAFAIWGGTIGGMAAVGPLVGGWLTTILSWHWAFLINLPVIAVILAGTIALVPETRDPAGRRGIDPLGVVLSALGLGLLVFGLIEGQRYGWWFNTAPLDFGPLRWDFALSPVPVAFGLGIVALALFLMVEARGRRAGHAVLVDLSLFRLRSFSYGSIAALVVAMGEFGMLFALPLFVQGALGYSALTTGVLVLWLAVGTFLISAMTPRLAHRLGSRAVVRLGLLIEGIAILGLALSYGTDVSFWVLAAWLFLYGCGVGLATAQLTSVILADVPVEQSGEASGLQSTVRQLGSALGIAVLGTLLVSTLNFNLAAALSGVTGLADTLRDGLLTLVTETAGTAIARLDDVAGVTPEIVAVTRQAMVDAARSTTLIAAGIIAIGLAATWGLPARDTGNGDRH